MILNSQFIKITKYSECVLCFGVFKVSLKTIRFNFKIIIEDNSEVHFFSVALITLHC
jgi:hypothetical protein